MSTYKEFIYMALDLCKISSDDSIITEDHVMFLLDKYRALILKQEIERLKITGESLSDSNYQTVCLELEEFSPFGDDACGSTYLRSKEKVPQTMQGTEAEVHLADYFSSEKVTFVSRERMRFTGWNKWLKRFIYASMGPDGRLWLTSSNGQFQYLERLEYTGIFENSEEAARLSCDDDGGDAGDVPCDELDKPFPIDDAFAPQLLQYVVKEIAQTLYIPQDSINNATDDLSDLARYISLNSKSSLAKQLDRS